LLPITPSVSQISPPVRVILVLSILFMLAWMTVLKPKEEAIPPANDPAVTQPVSAAQDAVNGANARQGQADAAADGIIAGAGTPATAGTTSGSAPTTSGGTAPKADDAVKAGEAGGLPISILKGIADKKVMVLLFWNKNASDDQAVRDELRSIDRHDGTVLVHVAPLGKVADYQQITRGANVDQSPTVVVVDGNRQVETLVGYADAGSIDQAVSDALRASR
jgi:hypothetical protein